MPSAISSGADISADEEGYDNDCDVTENKRRKSKIELDRYIIIMLLCSYFYNHVFLESDSWAKNKRSKKKVENGNSQSA